MVVKAECLALAGATWICVQTVRSSGVVANHWQHILSPPARMGDLPRYDSKGQRLFSPVWTSGATAADNRLFVEASVKAVAKVKVCCHLHPDLFLKQLLKSQY